MTAERSVYVVGAGGHGRLLLDAWRLGENPDPVGFLDDDPAKKDLMIDGLRVLGSVRDNTDMIRGATLIMGIGAVDKPTVRLAAIDRLTELGSEFATVTHPSAIISPAAQVGAGCTILAGVIVNRGARLGPFVTLYSGTIVEHDTEIGDHTQMAPGVVIAGNVRIGKRVFIGMGANISHGVEIGDDSVVGAGSVVLRDLSPNSRVAGVPARPIPLH
ncbi:MAG TPA: acetyltransferase [Gemmatimonadaceae bacterium]|nr:acetyltransferase [Gemmatimonadaceae bacterium]